VFKNLVRKESKAAALSLVDDPASLLLADLRRNFDDAALFFHDPYGGRVVGIVWKPAVYSYLFVHAACQLT
jgi:hypothetical protein